MRKEVFLVAGLTMVLSCSAGTSGSGGALGSGGARAAGGSPGSGGGIGAGGAGETGGESGGGSDGTGGYVGTGGLAASGGSLGKGGASGTGGRTGGVGGSMAMDAAVGTGGRGGPVGGAVSSGGNTSASGGSSGTGSVAVDGGAATVSCDRTGLQAAVDSYLAALASADTSKMPLDSSVKYTEVTSAASAKQPTAMGAGLWKTGWPVKFSRSLLDVTACETFTEIFITSGSHPYVLGTRLAIKDGKIAEIYTLATDSDDWNFDAAAYGTCSESEDWSPVAPANQSTREQLIAAGQAYFDIFSDKSAQVPWGSPCYRLEGGKGCTPALDKSSNSCNVGIPDGITFKNTHWVVDVDLNAVVGITLFGGASPDSHMFRLVNGKIRYVHTLTIMT